MTDLEKALNAGQIASHGARTAHHAPCACTCDVPIPMGILGTDGEHGAQCSLCGERLNVDSIGEAYRRWPGDLYDVTMQTKRVAEAAIAENLRLVRTLPKREQERLLALSRTKPGKFAKEVKAIAKREQRSRDYSAVDLKPTERARRRALAEQAAAAADRHAARLPEAQRAAIVEEPPTISPESP